MLCVQDQRTDPCFNLAAEEYVLKNFSDDCFMLWRSDPSIIVGKHQNALAEINLDFVREKGIRVVRRLSGGGTVFHDLGNLNFTFIVSGEAGKLVDFRRFTKPILEVLHKLGVEAQFEGRNNLTIGGLKISGNAEHVYRKRTLHHGTLLFSSVMSDLSQALKVHSQRYTDKAVQSVRSKVTNISEHLSHPMKVEEFSDMIMQHIHENYGGDRIYAYTEADTHAIEKLCDEKYRQWAWNFGYSPKYVFERSVRVNGADIGFHIQVEQGVIREIRIHGDFWQRSGIGVIEKALLGLLHEPDAIRACLSGFDIDAYFRNISLDDLVAAMF